MKMMKKERSSGGFAMGAQWCWGTFEMGAVSGQRGVLARTWG